MTINGYEFLYLLIQQMHMLLAVKNIATLEIPKYSMYKSIYLYTR